MRDSRSIEPTSLQSFSNRNRSALVCICHPPRLPPAWVLQEGPEIPRACGRQDWLEKAWLREAVKKHPTPGGLYTTVLESRSLRSGCLGVGFWRGPSSGVFGCLPGPQVLGGGGARWAPFQEDTARSCGLSRYDLVPSQRPPPNAITSGVRFPDKDLGRGHAPHPRP